MNITIFKSKDYPLIEKYQKNINEMYFNNE